MPKYFRTKLCSTFGNKKKRGGHFQNIKICNMYKYPLAYFEICAYFVMFVQCIFFILLDIYTRTRVGLLLSYRPHIVALKQDSGSVSGKIDSSLYFALWWQIQNIQNNDTCLFTNQLGCVALNKKKKIYKKIQNINSAIKISM